MSALTSFCGTYFRKFDLHLNTNEIVSLSVKVMPVIVIAKNGEYCTDGSLGFFDPLTWHIVEECVRKAKNPGNDVALLENF